MSLAWFQGRLRPLDDVRIAPDDRGLLFGDAVFETLRTYEGFPFDLEAHRSRLAASLRTSGIAEADVVEAAWTALPELVAANGLAKGDAAVRLTVTAGRGGRGTSRTGRSAPTVLMTAAPIPHAPTVHEHGIRLASVPVARGDAALAHVKSNNYLAHIMARAQAQAAGADDALLVDLGGHVMEASSANIFAREGDTITTPPVSAGGLPGLTRGHILALAPAAGYAVEERVLVPQELATADEVLLTASLLEVAPVVALDGAAIGDGRPGPAARALLACYHERVAQARQAARPNAKRS